MPFTVSAALASNAAIRAKRPPSQAGVAIKLG
jgi:hypothetical protein